MDQIVQMLVNQLFVLTDCLMLQILYQNMWPKIGTMSSICTSLILGLILVIKLHILNIYMTVHGLHSMIK